MMELKKALLAALAAVVITGCAVSPRAPGPSGGLHIEGVPFFSQADYMCGPAALASVIGYYGAGTEMAEVAREVYSERLKGTLPMDLLIYAKGRGFDARYYKGSMADLKESIGRGEPLILFLNLGYSFYPVGHYVVAVGMDEAGGVVYAHSGTERQKAYTVDELEGAWARTGYSTLIVKPRQEQR